MNTLDEIAIKYETDKSSKFHYYTRYYENYFEYMRNKSIKILEIGVQNGYSIQMWKDYFNNAEKIVGIDIDINKSKHLNNSIVKIIQGNQCDINFLKSININFGPFDIIIDDGSHINSSMRISFDYLFPLLKNDGFYVIEDLHCCYWKFPEFNNDTPNFIEYLKTLIDDVNNRGKYCLGDRDKCKCKNEKRWVDKNLEGLEKIVDSIFFHKSICFIKKHEINDQY